MIDQLKAVLDAARREAEEEGELSPLLKGAAAGLPAAGSRRDGPAVERYSGDPERLAAEESGEELPVRVSARESLSGLYRRVAEAVGRLDLPPAAGTEAMGEEGRWRREPMDGMTAAGAGAAGLTVEELDRAVRRDSRRYDGGMSIY